MMAGRNYNAYIAILISLTISQFSLVTSVSAEEVALHKKPFNKVTSYMCKGSHVPVNVALDGILASAGIPASLMYDNFNRIDLKKFIADTSLPIKTHDEIPARKFLEGYGLWGQFGQMSDAIGVFLSEGHSQTKAYTVENPHNTRGQGALKTAFLVTELVKIACAKPGAKPQSGFKLLVRAKPEDLSVKGLAKVKKLDHAGLSFETNEVADKSKLSANLTLGIATKLPTSPYLFVQFQSSVAKEAENIDDPDNPGQTITQTKVTRTETLSPGLHWKGGDWIEDLPFLGTGSWGGTLKPVFDFEHNAEYIAGTIWAKPTFLWGNKKFGCGRNIFLGFLNMVCEATGFVEAAHIFDAGSHPKLNIQDFSEFIGIGAEISAKFRIDSKSLRSFFIKGKYRYMGVLSGKLGDQERYEYGVGYTLPDYEHIAIEATWLKGENTTSYVHEDQMKIQLGIRF